MDEKWLTYFKNGLTKYFRKMNLDCKFPENPSHFTFSWCNFCQAQSVGVSSIETGFYSSPPFCPLSPHPPTSSAAISWNFQLQDNIDNFHSLIWGWTAGPHSSPPRSLLPRHLVWLLALPTANILKVPHITTKHHLYYLLRLLLKAQCLFMCI